jgi:HTH-type transcriptional regulator, glycine betaine synthesis regulator
VSDQLDKLRRGLTEEFGNIYENYGLARLKGLVVGLLLAHDEPLSLDDIAAHLGRSKGPISQTVRELSLAGLIRKRAGDNTRRDYYVADADLFLTNFRRNMRTVAKNRNAAQTFLRELDRLPEDDAYLRHNLEQMHAFYSLMEDFYGRFEEAWQQAKPPRQPL